MRSTIPYEHNPPVYAVASPRSPRKLLTTSVNAVSAGNSRTSDSTTPLVATPLWRMPPKETSNITLLLPPSPCLATTLPRSPLVAAIAAIGSGRVVSWMTQTPPAKRELIDCTQSQSWNFCACTSVHATTEGMGNGNGNGSESHWKRQSLRAAARIGQSRLSRHDLSTALHPRRQPGQALLQRGLVRIAVVHVEVAEVTAVLRVLRHAHNNVDVRRRQLKPGHKGAEHEHLRPGPQAADERLAEPKRCHLGASLATARAGDGLHKGDDLSVQVRCGFRTLQAAAAALFPLLTGSQVRPCLRTRHIECPGRLWCRRSACPGVGRRRDRITRRRPVCAGRGKHAVCGLWHSSG